jgi:hypothetical protein
MRVIAVSMPASTAVSDIDTAITLIIHDASDGSIRATGDAPILSLADDILIGA